jgi:hypothetical protein
LEHRKRIIEEIAAASEASNGAEFNFEETESTVESS